MIFQISPKLSVARDDKGLGIVVMDRSVYKDKINSMLNDTNTYHKTQEHHTQHIRESR